jgi:8-oxo-dGTP pyrophosphatase MutT (NUDIX family)
MLVRLHRFAYRVAAPVVWVGWGLLGTRHDGVRCVIRRSAEVLLVRHTYGDRRRWDFPGGFVRRGEAPPAAAAREMREELGLLVDVGDLRDLGPTAPRHGRRRGTVHQFLIDIAGRTVERDPVELAEVGWFHPDGLPKRLGEDVRELVERAGPAAAGARTPCVSIGADQSGESRRG